MKNIRFLSVSVAVRSTSEDPNNAHHKVTVIYKTRHISDITERISINE